jgi:hypothetical protein
MKPAALPAIGQRIAAIFLTLAAFAAFIAVIAAPLAEAWLARRDAHARLDRFEATLAAADPHAVRYDPEELAAVHLDDAEAQVALQSRLGAIAREAGLPVQSIRPMSAELLGEVGRAVWVEVSLMGDLEAFAALMTMLDQERPTLLLRRLEIDKGDSPRPGTLLRIRMEAGRAWRQGTPPQADATIETPPEQEPAP